MNCISCGNSFSLISSLEAAKFAWPKLRAFWYECVHCKSGNHIRVSDGRYQQIKIIGAPGPEWNVIKTFSEKSLSYRQDQSYFHIWLKEKHYEIRAKS